MPGADPDRPITVVLVHHADAVGPDVDPQRPLSARGRAQAEQLAGRAQAAGVRPDVIWHSGKLRARQTAEPFLRLCNPLADFRMVPGLRPNDSPRVARDMLEPEGRHVLVVSHMPVLPALARLLAPSIDQFPMNGLVLLERTPGGGYVERWRAAPDL